MMDLSKQAKKRILWQYRNGMSYQSWIDIIPSIAQTEIEDPAQIVVDILDIDNRAGEQLDIIGRIVGLSRPPVIKKAEEGVTDFGPDASLAPQFGDDGAQFGSEKYIVKDAVSDELFRVLIKARVVQNNSDGTINDVVTALRFIGDVQDVQVNDNKDMTFSVSLGDQLNETTRFALRNFDVLPRPQGVRFLGFVESDTYVQFGSDFATFGDDRTQFNSVFI